VPPRSQIVSPGRTNPRPPLSAVVKSQGRWRLTSPAGDPSRATRSSAPAGDRSIRASSAAIPSARASWGARAAAIMEFKRANVVGSALGRLTPRKSLVT